MTPDESLSIVLRSLFRRRGMATEFTKPFDLFPIVLQSHILSRISPLPIETPIVATIFSIHHWLLLTTKRSLQILKILGKRSFLPRVFIGRKMKIFASQRIFIIWKATVKYLTAKGDFRLEGCLLP